MASDGRKKNGGLNRINDVVSAKNQKKRNLNKYEEAQLGTAPLARAVDEAVQSSTLTFRRSQRKRHREGELLGFEKIAGRELLGFKKIAPTKLFPRGNNLEIGGTAVGSHLSPG